MVFGLEDLLNRIIVRADVMAGKPVIRDTRITVDLVLELLGKGMKPEEIAEDYNIEVEDVYAALLYAAKILSREEVIIAET
ncbi:MAG: DUF433 domain-containing protein [Candidatus Bathyarchaeia archaeon]